MRLQMFLALGALLAAPAAPGCSRSSPSPPDAAPALAPLTPSELCQRLMTRFGDGGGRAFSASTMEALGRCVEMETSEEHAGAEHWRCHASCVGAAGNEDAVAECDTRCPLPDVRLDCGSIVSVADVIEAYGASATALPDSPMRDSFCGHAFKVNDETLVVSAAVYRSMRGLYLFTEGQAEEGVETETAPKLGDRAVRFGRVLSTAGEHECGVKLAQRRVGVTLTVKPKQPGCPFDRLERIAAKIALRVP